ncbi:MAG: gluconokinase [Armatimonadetes bacterium]|nr:gluconokinase [Akkermansiaceae bacterium]
MGVAGSGKTTIGQLLALRHGGKFFDADDYHPPGNVAKMSLGIPLNDTDRLPWLNRLRSEVIDASSPNEFTVLACSALKHSYRKILGLHQPGIGTVFLNGDPATLAERLSSRAGHYMKPGMLDSQLETLEVPSMTEAFHIPIILTPQQIVERIEIHFQIPPA